MLMAVLLSRKETAFVRSARIAHLATAGANGQPMVIPICFVYDGKHYYSPIDEKPKRVEPGKLRRLRNIVENSRVALIIDRYDEDWRRLAYILITGKARVLTTGIKYRRAIGLLRRKYRQYRAMAIETRPMVMITPKHFKSWGNP
jgi:PPOX class probable F420-dependent enzyme